MPTALRVVRKFFPNVKSVKDAERNATIEVTPSDQAKATKKSHKTCAMAVACKRKFNLDGVIISRSTAYLIKGTQARRFHVPETVSREVVSFDRGGGFATGEYHLAKLSPTNKMEAAAKAAKDRYREKRTGHHGGTDAKREIAHRTSGIRVALGSKMAAE